MFARACRDIARFYRKSWWFSALMQLASGLLIAIPLTLIVQIATAIVRAQGAELAADDGISRFVIILLVVSIVVCLPVALVGLSATVRTINDSLAGRRRRFWAAIGEGFRNIPALAAAASLTLVGVVVLAAASPLFIALGLIALILTPVVRLVRRRREGFAHAWPSLVTLAWMIAPLGLALRFVAGAMFFAPAVVLDGLGPIAALRAGARVARPRRLRLVGFVVAGVLLSVALQAGVAWLGSLAQGTAGSLIGQVAVQLLLVAFPAVLVTVLFRLGSAEDAGDSLPASRTEPYARGTSVLPERRRPAITTVPGLVTRVAMIMPFVVVIAGVGLAPTAASAAPSVGASAALQLTVNTDADTLDDAALAAQATNCVSGSGECTLRAAVRAAQDASNTGSYGSIGIGFDGSYTIAIAGSPIAFSGGGRGESGGGEGGGGEGGESGGEGGEGEGGEGGSEGGSGVLIIDGGGNSIVIDGQSASQVLTLHSNSWGFQLSRLQISNAGYAGSEALGGGVSITTPAASLIDSVTFDGNDAEVGGGAVMASGTQLTIVNSTFSGNSTGLNSAVGYPNAGADVYAMYSANVVINNSTFVGYTHGSVFNWGASGAITSVSNSLFDVRDGTSVVACNGGSISGSSNVVTGDDTSCPDTIPNPGASVSDLRMLAAGGPAVMTLVPTADNAAIDAAGGNGVECQTTDQRGHTRPAVGCDAGAVELDPTTTTTIASSNSSVVFGSPVTFTANVELADGGSTVSTGSVSFDVDGVSAGPAVAVTGGSASVIIDTLSSGTHSIVATFVPVDATRIGGSQSTALTQEVTKSGSTVTLTSSANPALVSDGATLTATVTAQEPTVVPTGTVTLRDAAGPIGSSVTLVNGVATFALSGVTPGRHTLVAAYAGDADNAPADSAALEQVLRVTSAVTTSASETNVEFGQDVTFDVSVPSVQSLTAATGNVLVRWNGGSRLLTLDATGSATTVISGLTLGSSSITAEYTGDDRYASSTAADLPLTVTAATTTTTLAVADDSIDYGVPVTLTATVARTSGAAPAGSVTFYSGETELQTVALAAGTGGTSTASYTPSPGQLRVGKHTITASFVPSTGYTASASVASTITVSKAATSVAVSSDPSSVPAGTPVDLTATVVASGDSLGVPDGTVEFFDGTDSLGTASISGGIATLSHSFGAPGSRSITAKYSGSFLFLDASSPVHPVTVSAEAVVTTLTVTPGGSTGYGTRLLLGVTVAGVTVGSPAVGTVVVRDGATVVATIDLTNGAGSQYVTSPSTGTHSYQATFVPSTSSFAGGVSAVVDHRVDAASTSTTLTFSKPSSVHGDPVTLTATVSSAGAAPAGTVTFTTGDTTLGTATLVAGTGTSSVATLTVGIPQSADYPNGQRYVVATFAPSGDFTTSNAAVAYAVKRGTTALTFALVGSVAGQPQSLVATVTSLTGTGSPAGTVTFAGGSGASGTAALVDGVATLTGVVLPAGDRLVFATYSSVDRNFDAPAPSTIDRTVTVTRGTPRVVLTSSSTGAIGFGSLVTLTATVGTTLIAPTGAVQFTATGNSGVTDLGSVALSSGSSAALETRAIPLGTQSITATYLGDGNFVSVTSSALSQEVAPTATTTALTVTDSPSFVNDPITLRAAVTATGATVNVGTVQFLRGGVVLDTVAVDSSGIATYRYTPTAIGTEALEARYTAASAVFGSSSATAQQVVQGRSVIITLFQPGSFLAVGESRLLRAQVYGGDIRPTGTITISDGAGTSCDLTLAPTSDYGYAAGECALQFATAGTRTLTATYNGDAQYAAATSETRSLTVTTKETGLSLTSPARWIAGQPVTLDWKVIGPTTPGAAVRISDGDITICTSTALSGSCTYTFARDRAEAYIGMSYAGTAEWGPKSTLLTASIGTCSLLGTMSASPSIGGTVSVITEPNCGTDGYLPGTAVVFMEKPADGFTFTNWGDPQETNRYFAVIATGGRPVFATAHYARPCVSVTFSAIGGSSYGGTELENLTAPNCGDGWTGSDSRSRTGSFLVGTVIDLKATPPTQPKGSDPWGVYGWGGLAAGADQTALRQSYTVTPDLFQEVSVTFGVVCVRDLRVEQPTGATVTLGAPNCWDNAGAGYKLGSKVSVSATSNGTAYFTGWKGGNVTPLTDTNSTAVTALVTVYSTNPPVVAGFAECISFSVNAPGYIFLGNNDVQKSGTTTLDLAGNCPTKGAGWYRSGTRVNVDTTGLLGTKFAGWKTNAQMSAPASFTKNSFFLLESGSADAVWYSEQQCKPYSVTTMPAGAVTAAVDLHGETSCPDGQININAGGFSGARVTLTATATGGNPMLGWTGTTNRWVTRTESVPARLSPTTVNPLDVQMVGNSSYTAWACQAINTTLTLVSPNGTKHSEPLPAGTDFVGASPAPDCPLTASAYTVGQSVFPQALGETAGYTFTGWSGAVNSTELYPTSSITLDGASKSVDLTATYQVNCFKLTTNTQHTKVDPAPNCPDTDASQNMYIGGTSITLQTIGNAGTKVFRGFTGGFDGQSGIYSWVTITKDTAIYSNYETRSAGEAIVDALSDAADGAAILAKKTVGVIAAGVAAFVMGDNPVLMVASLVVLLGTAVQAIADAMGQSSDGLKNFTSGITALSQMLTFLQAGALCATVWSASGSVSQAKDISNSATAQVGSVIANRIIEAKDAAADAKAAQKAAQAAAIAAMSDAKPATALGSVADKASDLYASAKGPLQTVGRLGEVAMVGYMVYSEYQNANTGWDSSAKSAWTEGGDVYTNCLLAAVPPYFNMPKQTS